MVSAAVFPSAWALKSLWEGLGQGRVVPASQGLAKLPGRALHGVAGRNRPSIHTSWLRHWLAIPQVHHYTLNSLFPSPNHGPRPLSLQDDPLH